MTSPVCRSRRATWAARTSIRRGIAALSFTAACSGGAPAPLSETERAEAAASVTERMQSLAGAMEARNTDRVMSHFRDDPGFVVVVDTAVYATYDSLRADLRRGYGMFDRVEMHWMDLDVAIVGHNVAAVTATFEQRTVMSGGTPWNTSGRWSGVLVRADSGWQIVRVHQQTLP